MTINLHLMHFLSCFLATRYHIFWYIKRLFAIDISTVGFLNCIDYFSAEKKNPFKEISYSFFVFFYDDRVISEQSDLTKWRPCYSPYIYIMLNAHKALGVFSQGI